MKKIEMIKGAKKLVDVCTKVKKGENVLIIPDTCIPVGPAMLASTRGIHSRSTGF